MRPIHRTKVQQKDLSQTDTICRRYLSPHSYNAFADYVVYVYDLVRHLNSPFRHHTADAILMRNRSYFVAQHLHDAPMYRSGDSVSNQMIKGAGMSRKGRAKRERLIAWPARTFFGLRPQACK